MSRIFKIKPNKNVILKTRATAHLMRGTSHNPFIIPSNDEMVLQSGKLTEEITGNPC
jgi:hypothetical protein